MTGLAASFLIPLMTVYYPVETFIPQTPTLTVVENIHASRHPVDIYSILFYLYVFFGAFFIIRQLFLLVKINIRIHSSGYTIVNDCRLVDSPDTKTPFSFYNYIFGNFRQIPESERRLILAHERSHIIQRHWIDLIIAESVRIFLWFNPFVWFYQYSIKENHEYLADKAVIGSGYSPVSYRAALINQSLNIPVFSLVNSFTSYKFKRISMMKKEISNPLKKLAALLLIPAAGLFLWAFAEPEYHVTFGEAPQQTSNVYPANDSVPVETPKVYNTVVKNVPVVSPKDTLKSEAVAIGVEKMNQLPEVLATDTDQSQITVRGVRLEPLYIIDGVESASLSKLPPEQIESVRIIKDEEATTIYGEKGKNGVILITTKNINQLPEVLATDTNQSQIIVQKVKVRQDSSPLYIIDGKESSISIEELDAGQIESVDVIKNEKATSIYGEKGKNGVVLITTKRQ
jgi:TonB-dependent SusC/RagA subfamily outer membrane receptor